MIHLTDVLLSAVSGVKSKWKHSISINQIIMEKSMKFFLAILILALTAIVIFKFSSDGSTFQGSLGADSCGKKVLYSFMGQNNFNNNATAFFNFVENFDKNASRKCMYKITLFRPENNNDPEVVSLTCPKYGNINHAGYFYGNPLQGIFTCMLHLAGVSAQDPFHPYDYLFSKDAFEGIGVSLDSQGVFNMHRNSRLSKDAPLVVQHYRNFEISVDGFYHPS